MGPELTHAYPDLCVWSAPDTFYAQYDQVFTGRVLQSHQPHRVVFFVDTVLKGRQIEVGTKVSVRIHDWWPQQLDEGIRYTVPAYTEWVPASAQKKKIHSPFCAPITYPVINPTAYGLTVIDSLLPPHFSRYRS